MSRFVTFCLAVFLWFSPSWAIEAQDKTEVAKGCQGINLVDALPDNKKAELMAIVAAIPNYEGLFWKIEKPGIAPSYLYGTIHSSDPRVLALKAPVQHALQQADRVVLELAELRSQEEIGKNALTLITDYHELVFYGRNESLKKDSSPQYYAQIKKILDGHHMAWVEIAAYKPWFIYVTLQYPKCAQENMMSFLDAVIGREAYQNGQPVLGLETFAEQTEVLALMPITMQLALLASVPENDQGLTDSFSTMLDLYLAEKTGYMVAIDPYLLASSMDKAIYKAFYERLLDERNIRMVKRAIPLLESGNSFIAIGAAHLPGQKGLIELLRAEGYTISRIK